MTVYTVYVPESGLEGPEALIPMVLPRSCSVRFLKRAVCRVFGGYLYPSMQHFYTKYKHQELHDFELRDAAGPSSSTHAAHECTLAMYGVKDGDVLELYGQRGDPQSPLRIPPDAPRAAPPAPVPAPGRPDMRQVADQGGSPTAIPGAAAAPPAPAALQPGHKAGAPQQDTQQVHIMPQQPSDYPPQGQQRHLQQPQQSHLQQQHMQQQQPYLQQQQQPYLQQQQQQPHLQQQQQQPYLQQQQPTAPQPAPSTHTATGSGWGAGAGQQAAIATASWGGIGAGPQAPRAVSPQAQGGGRWDPEQVVALLEAMEEHGNQWALIAKKCAQRLGNRRNTQLSEKWYNLATTVLLNKVERGPRMAPELKQRIRALARLFPPEKAAR